MPSLSSTSFDCPVCRARIAVGSGEGGTSYRCPVCGATGTRPCIRFWDNWPWLPGIVCFMAMPWSCLCGIQADSARGPDGHTYHDAAAGRQAGLIFFLALVGLILSGIAQMIHRHLRTPRRPEK